MTDSKTSSRVAFGVFEADLRTEELWKGQYRVKLQNLPFKLLKALIQSPGQVLTREELQQRLWGSGTTVDFDHSLAAALNKLREALGDSAENPRYIETLSRRGYRFIAAVSVPAPDLNEAEHLQPFPSSSSAQERVEHVADPEVRSPGEPHRAARVPSSGLRLFWVSAAVIGVLLAAMLGNWIVRRQRGTTPARIQQLTQDGHFVEKPYFTELFPIGVSDGIHLFLPKTDSGELSIAALPVDGGTPVPLTLPAEVVNPALSDISADHSRLLVRSRTSSLSEQQLWIVPTTGNSAQRVGGVLAHDATWMPDGSILYANGNSLYTVDTAGGNRRKFAELPGRDFWLRWSPSGKLLRLTISDPGSHTSSLWQLTRDDATPHRLLPSDLDSSAECCGVWSPDGTSYIYQSRHSGSLDLWRMDGERSQKSVRFTDGPLDFGAPITAPGSRQVFFLGSNSHSELDRVGNGALVPVKGFLSRAYRFQFSADRKWVLWTDEGHLWRAAADGTHKVQLTPASLDVFSAAWSPDGGRLALMARASGAAWKLYLMTSDGGNLQPLDTGSRNAADPSWSPDGSSLVFGRVNDEFGQETEPRTLQIIDLRSGSMRQLPHSEGMFSPRWSPNGRYIAALTLDQHQIRVFDVSLQSWSALKVPSAADPVWTSDSRSLFVHAALEPEQPVLRISVPDGHVDEVSRLTSISNAVSFIFSGLMPDGTPVVRTISSSGDIYRKALE